SGACSKIVFIAGGGPGSHSIIFPPCLLILIAVAITQRRYRTNLSGGFCPRVHYSVVSGKNRVFACVRWLCLPYTPQTVHLRMMQPKYWICWRSGDESHCATDPSMNSVVNEFQLSHKIDKGCHRKNIVNMSRGGNHRT